MGVYTGATSKAAQNKKGQHKKTRSIDTSQIQMINGLSNVSLFANQYGNRGIKDGTSTQLDMVEEITNIDQSTSRIPSAFNMSQTREGTSKTYLRKHLDKERKIETSQDDRSQYTQQ